MGPAFLALTFEFDIPPGLKALFDRPAIQLVYTSEPPDVDDPRLVPLGNEDAPDMLALAQLTEPGPFATRTHELGQFWGVKQDGQLIAMAGERMRQPGYSEISAICTHPDHRGLGLGKSLCLKVTRSILDRGETPYLHAFADNATAIRLYEGLGFRGRIGLRALALGLA